MSPLSMSKDGVLTLSGYGVRVWIEHGHLCAEDGIGSERRKVRLSKVTSGLKRLVVLGHSGTISFEALRWIRASEQHSYTSILTEI